MSGETVRSDFGRNTLPDYMTLLANVLYAVAGLLFLGGLYFDWQRPGINFFAAYFESPLFMLADEPAANSGLFILSIIVLLVAYIISRLADLIVDWQTETVDQTQEWTVDVGDDT